MPVLWPSRLVAGQRDGYERQNLKNWMLATMTKLHLGKSLILGLLLPCLTGCEKGYPPVVANAYQTPVEILIAFVGVAQPVGGVLPAGCELVQHRQGLILESVTIKEGSGKLRIYKASDFTTVRGNRVLKTEVWFVSEDGLKLGDEKDLWELKRNKRL
jgi:hypothetical protein